ncbi:MAG: flagellar biosynthesis protein FlhB [Phycisphaerae bacterium]|nr:flagellar biosynthesis protein FlhB [Phycisphaerae bacterium]
MPGQSGEKTEAPTPKRIQEAREKGQVAKSADLCAAVGLIAGLLILNFYGKSMMVSMMDLLTEYLSVDKMPATGQLVLDQAWRQAAMHFAAILAPMLLILFVIAIVVNLFQVGFMFVSKPLTPSFEKISPLAGFKRMFSARSAVKLMMSLLKVTIIATVAYFTIKSLMPEIMTISSLGFMQVLSVGGGMVFMLGMRLALVLLVLAIIDYSYQKYQMIQDLKMTKQEIKEEMKRMEGDPMMKQRRRQIARQLAMQRMSQAVPQADVIVTNPTHFAIALKYDPNEMDAPKVVAKGADYMAKRIREIAMENNVPIMERKPLARALYKSCEVGDSVPPELYKAVAEVLAYVFELAGKGFKRSIA